VFVVILSVVCVIQLCLTLGSVYVIYKSRYSRSALVLANPFRSAKISSGRQEAVSGIAAGGGVGGLDVTKKEFMGSGFMSRPSIERLTPEFLRENY